MLLQFRSTTFFYQPPSGKYAKILRTFRLIRNHQVYLGVQGDPVRDLVAKYQGEAEACKRHVLAADAVTADTRGLQQLVAAGNYRAAINHTALLLEMYGQGRIQLPYRIYTR